MCVWLVREEERQEMDRLSVHVHFGLANEVFDCRMRLCLRLNLMPAVNV